MVYQSNDAIGGGNTNYGHPYSCYKCCHKINFMEKDIIKLIKPLLF